jgi:predicted nuclease of predicted toxin-antitoxin system
MNLLADENIEIEIVDLLRSSGYNVEYILENSPSIDDKKIIQQSNESNSILITSDKDFGELVFRQHLVHNGVVLIRLHGISAEKKASLILDFLKNHADTIQNAFSVITHSSIRIRSKID